MSDGEVPLPLGGKLSRMLRYSPLDPAADAFSMEEEEKEEAVEQL